uniref:Uncharacterized protein n=1 Tax=viral metagenome TaxID=1070528 RepID=A0A6M3XRW4_9ZZZZ
MSLEKSKDPKFWMGRYYDLQYEFYKLKGRNTELEQEKNQLEIDLKELLEIVDYIVKEGEMARWQPRKTLAIVSKLNFIKRWTAQT